VLAARRRLGVCKTGGDTLCTSGTARPFLVFREYVIVSTHWKSHG
jgi:hypothetical protein